MATRVGSKGQVVIEKEIRDELGIEEGSLAIQTVVGDHVEIEFLPPEHNDSLYGALSHLTDVVIPPEKWAEATERARAEAAREKMERSGGIHPVAKPPRLP